MTQPIRMSSLATEYVKLQLSATENGVPVDPTFGTVEFAFMDQSETPGSGDWVEGEWESSLYATYYARCLVGPLGPIELPVGEYDVWIRADLDPQLLVDKIGDLVIF